MFLERRQFTHALLVAGLVTGTLSLIGCGGNADQTGPGETGIGAPGKLPDTPVPSEDEAYKLQQERDKEISKESRQ